MSVGTPPTFWALPCILRARNLGTVLSHTWPTGCQFSFCQCDALVQDSEGRREMEGILPLPVLAANIQALLGRRTLLPCRGHPVFLLSELKQQLPESQLHQQTRKPVTLLPTCIFLVFSVAFSALVSQFRFPFASNSGFYFPD